MVYEADPRHVEKLLREAGLEDCKSVSTPGVKEAPTTTSTTWFEESGLSPESESVRGGLNLVADAPDAPDPRFLDREEMRSYRFAVARCNYLAIDRFEIASTTKELCRGMANPTEEDLQRVNRLVIFLKGLPRMIQKIPFADNPPSIIRAYVDSDCTGCRKTR